MGPRSEAGPVLALIDGSRHDGELLMVARDIAATKGGPLIMVAVAVIEPERRGGCDLRSGVWNRMQRELASDQLRRAQQELVPDACAVFALAQGPSVEAAVMGAADSRGCGLIVVPYERRSLLPWRATLADRLRNRGDREIVTLDAHGERDL